MTASKASASKGRFSQSPTTSSVLGRFFFLSLADHLRAHLVPQITAGKSIGFHNWTERQLIPLLQIFIVLHEVDQIKMPHAFAPLQERIQCEKVARVSISDMAEWSVLALFYIAVGDRHRHLDVSKGHGSWR